MKSSFFFTGTCRKIERENGMQELLGVLCKVTIGDLQLKNH